MTTIAAQRTARPGRPSLARRVAAPAGIALACAAGVVVVYAVFVRTALGQAVDEMAMRGARVDHARLVNLLNSTLDGTSLTSVGLVALLAAAIGLVRRRIDLAVAAGILVVGANVTTQLLKPLLTRPLFEVAGPNSLPSGHTTAAASVAFALVLVLPHAVRALVALAGAGYAATIAVATVWAAWHRPSDVLAALLVVLAWGAAAVTLVRATRHGYADGERPASRVASMPLAVGALISGAIAVLGLAAVVLALRAWPALASHTVAFLAGAAGMCSAAAAAFLVWLTLVSGDVRPATPTGDRSGGGHPDG